MSKYCQLQLTCADKGEAEKISAKLLEKKIIACAKQTPVSSSFRWKGKIDTEDEVLLLMESREDLFKKIEEEIANLHSYETFVLVAAPLVKVSKKAQAWLNESLDG